MVARASRYCLLVIGPLVEHRIHGQLARGVGHYELGPAEVAQRFTLTADTSDVVIFYAFESGEASRRIGLRQAVCRVPWLGLASSR